MCNYQRLTMQPNCTGYFNDAIFSNQNQEMMDHRNCLVHPKTVQEGKKIVVDFTRFYGCLGVVDPLVENDQYGYVYEPK